jgi:hypothetical protein
MYQKFWSVWLKPVGLNSWNIIWWFRYVFHIVTHKLDRDKLVILQWNWNFFIRHIKHTNLLIHAAIWALGVHFA